MDCPPTFESAGLVLVVDKADFRMGAYRDGALIRREDGTYACFPVALGAEPAGDKRAQGDERTPEGEFRVTHKNPKSSFHLSLGLNYPTKRHAEAAFTDGRISADVRDRVVAADAPGKMPVRNTVLGGDIYLHGGGSEPAWWTDGCVAIANADMDWLFAEVKPGTRVVIRP